MKKNYFLGAAAAFGLFAFSSCSSDNDPISKPELMTGDQVIVLDMQDTDVLSTKSRPLYSTSNKGAEQVTDVQLLVFGYNQTANQYEYVKKLTAISNWNNTSSEYAYGRKKEFKLKDGDKLQKSTESTGYSKYIILAVGQDESTPAAGAPEPFNIITANNGAKLVQKLAEGDWTPGTTWNVASAAGNGFLTTKAIAENDPAGEIFSGVSTPIEFTADGGFSTTVLLKRQVAGVMGYFNRIPAEVVTTAPSTTTAVTGIRLVSAVKNTALDLSIVLDQQKDDATHGQPGNQTTEKVVNGYTPATPGAVQFKNGNKAYAVYTIDLKNWFKWDEAAGKWDDSALLNEAGEDGIKLLGNVKGWHNALDASNSANVTVADGAVFAGNFVIPFANNKSVSAVNNTFELQLINTSSDGTTVTVLKAWDVKLDPLSQGVDDGDKVYNVYRNHLYQIGKRGSGDTPTNPGVDPDKPQPLDKDQELIIKINDQWEFIHDMEIE